MGRRPRGPVCRPDGTVQAFFAQKIDLTEAKQREAELAGYVSDAMWLARTRDALDENRMLLYWQPIVDLRTGATVQRELLLRMCDADGTIVAPGQFLPVAERYGLISEIDRWVIRHAVGLAAEGVPTEFNVSAASISDPDVLRELATAIETTGVDPSLLVVEVTETAMLDHLEAGRTFADQLRALGCGLAIDDFGTGFASLSQLRHLHGEHLKIDMEFVRDITRNETDERLVRGIVGLAREFGQVTTAEGIEDEETLAKLRDLGVDRGQGYLFARPGRCLTTLRREPTGSTGQPVPPIPWPRSGQRFRPSRIATSMPTGGCFIPRWFSGRWPPTGEPTTRAAAIADTPAWRPTSATSARSGTTSSSTRPPSGRSTAALWCSERHSCEPTVSHRPRMLCGCTGCAVI